jgi:hypothetical protein
MEEEMVPLDDIPDEVPDTVAQFAAAYAQALAQPLQTDGLLNRFVTNRAVTGAYAEAWIGRHVRSMLGLKFRISTGAVVRASDSRRDLSKVPQCDVIIWDPSELPAVFETGDFALVPLHSVRAIIEVKRTTSNVDGFQDQLKKRRSLLPRRRPLMGVVVRHSTSLFPSEACSPDWFEHWNWTGDLPITRMLDGAGNADTDGVHALTYFLAQVAGHSNIVAGAGS